MGILNINKGNSRILIWAIIIVIVLVVAFFMFKGGNKEGTSITDKTAQQDEISSLDVGENPDIGVDDLNSLQVSEEEITP